MQTVSAIRFIGLRSLSAKDLPRARPFAFLFAYFLKIGKIKLSREQVLTKDLEWRKPSRLIFKSWVLKWKTNN